MIIKELDLIHFGKFHNKKIILDSKVNLMYGPNESGKTTVWHFIIGMFFGFFKPYIKTRRYLDLHEKYQPWDGSNYCGAMTLYDELMGRTLRIYRDFRQGREDVTVHDVLTGENVTALYDIHPVYRLADVAKMHLSLSYSAYINMGAISQLGQETDENLGLELKEAVVNALSSRTLNVSMHKIQQAIKSKREEIGTQKRPTSDYAKNIEKLKTLYIKRQKVVENENSLIDLMEYERILDAKLQDVREHLQEIGRYEEYIDICEQRTRLRQIQKLQIEENIIQKKIAEIQANTHYSLQDLYAAKEKFKKKCEKELELKSLVDSRQEKEDEEIQIQDELQSIEEKRKKISQSNKFMRTKWIQPLWITFIIILLAGFLFTIYQGQGNVIFYMGSLLTITCVGWFYLRMRLKQYKKELHAIEQQSQSLHEHLSQVQELIANIVLMVRQKSQQIAELNDEVMPIMGMLGMYNISDFEESILEFQSLQNLQIQLIRIEEREKGLLLHQEYQSLLHNIETYDFEAYEQYLQGLNHTEMQRLKMNRNSLVEQEQELTHEYIRVSTLLKDGQMQLESLASIDEAISMAEKKKKDFDHQLTIYNIVESTLEKITQELKYEFSPSMNGELSQLMSIVTSGKYTDVKITPEMEILFKDPLTQKMQDTSHLSRGTVDLFYILFRYAVSKWNWRGQSIPLLLDEAFAFLDEQRLAQVMNVFANFEEQVLLFTCQDREKQLAEQKKFKVIAL